MHQLFQPNIIESIKSIILQNISAHQKIEKIVGIANSISPELIESVIDLLNIETIACNQLRQIYNEYILDMEASEMNSILQSDEIFDSFIKIAGASGKDAYDRVSEIFNSLKLNENMNVVMVGCGQLPVTAIHFAEKCSAIKITCLDVISHSIGLAKKLTSKLNLKNIDFVLTSGDVYDYKECDIIYVANMVTPKIDVIKQIARTAIKRPQVIVREPYSLGIAWADQCEPNIPSDMQVIAYGPGSRYLSRDVHLGWRT